MIPETLREWHFFENHYLLQFGNWLAVQADPHNDGVVEYMSNLCDEASRFIKDRQTLAQLMASITADRLFVRPIESEPNYATPDRPSTFATLEDYMREAIFEALYERMYNLWGGRREAEHNAGRSEA